MKRVTSETTGEQYIPDYRGLFIALILKHVTGMEYNGQDGCGSTPSELV